MTKAAAGTKPPKHPARFSTELLPVFAEMLMPPTTVIKTIEPEGEARVTPWLRVLDPFAGTGRIHRLAELGPFSTIGVEIEPEWAHMHERTFVGNALALQFDDDSFDAICTSPTYGNRFADKHNAQDGSVRRSYTHDLGRTLSPVNSGAMQWSEKYRVFHEVAWREARRVLKPGGKFVLNIKDHVRSGERQFVSGWHITTLARLGFTLQWHEAVITQGMRQGANADVRVDAEQVYLLTLDK